MMIDYIVLILLWWYHTISMGHGPREREPTSKKHRPMKQSIAQVLAITTYYFMLALAEYVRN